MPHELRHIETWCLSTFYRRRVKKVTKLLGIRIMSPIFKTHRPLPEASQTLSQMSAIDALCGDHTESRGIRTAIDVLPRSDRNATLIFGLWRLVRKLRAIPEVAATVHGLLKRVVLPAEDIITMLTKPSPSIC